MSKLTKISPNTLGSNPIELIGKEWMLVSAAGAEGRNSMTASWGSIGFFFNMPVATIVVRPERYTYEFIESSEFFTLTVLRDGHREALTKMGRLSGRNCDKVAEAGLNVSETESGYPTFEEARVVLVCRKIVSKSLDAGSFVDQEIYNKWYGDGHGGDHTMFMGEIVECYVAE